MPCDPIFIIGTERSGSNLLRLVLNAHSHIAVPHPPHILHYFAELNDRYGELTDDRNLGRLVDDVLGLLEVHIHPWELSVDRGRVLAQAAPRDIFGVFYALYDQFRELEGKGRWGCKSTFVIHHVARIRRTYPDARFVWLVRDPRDVAASSRRSVFSPFHPWFTAELWRQQQELGLQHERSLPAGSLLRMRYEDLLADPSGAVQRLAAFLDEPFEEGMLAYHRTDAARTASTLSQDWKNTASPVLQHNAGKYRKQLSATQIEWVESSCGPLMAELGYAQDTDADPSWQPSRQQRAAFAAWDTRWRAQVDERSERTDRNHGRRMARDAAMARLQVRRR